MRDDFLISILICIHSNYHKEQLHLRRNMLSWWGREIECTYGWEQDLTTPASMNNFDRGFLLLWHFKTFLDRPPKWLRHLDVPIALLVQCHEGQIV